MDPNFINLEQKNVNAELMLSSVYKEYHQELPINAKIDISDFEVK